MKCARKSCNETVNVIAKHRENGNTYCIRCARMINDACNEQLCTWDDGPTPAELALVAEIDACTDLIALDGLRGDHVLLPRHPNMGAHTSGCTDACPVAEAIRRAIPRINFAHLTTATPMQLLAFVLEHGGDLFDSEFGIDEDMHAIVDKRFEQLKAARPDVERYHAELRDVAEHAGAIVASGLPLFTTSEILNPFYAAGAVRIRKGDSE